MPVRLSTTISKIDNISNSKNTEAIKEFHRFMKSSNAGEKHINNNLKIIMSFTNTLGQNECLGDVKRSHILNFLDSKIKTPEDDPYKKWIIPQPNNLL